MQPSSPKLSAQPRHDSQPAPQAGTPGLSIHIEIASQTLELKQGPLSIGAFPISSSAWGLGHEEGSNKTPIGRFRICQKIGHGAPQGMVFKSRVQTGQIGTEEDPADLVQTRILWLEGAESHNANTRSRYIYIHGTNHESRIGSPCSHGCIRMRNADIIALFDLVDEGAEVVIA
jgi:hypothetical protein